MRQLQNLTSATESHICITIQYNTNNFYGAGIQSLR